MDIKLRKKHWTEWIVKRLSGNNEVDKETINFALNNYANEHGSELLNLYGVSNRRELFVKKQEEWLMVNTKISVEQIIEFKYESNLFK